MCLLFACVGTCVYVAVHSGRGCSAGNGLHGPKRFHSLVAGSSLTAPPPPDSLLQTSKAKQQFPKHSRLFRASVILRVLPEMPSSPFLSKILVDLPDQGFTPSVLSSWSPQTPPSGLPAASLASSLTAVRYLLLFPGPGSSPRICV